MDYNIEIVSPNPEAPERSFVVKDGHMTIAELRQQFCGFEPNSVIYLEQVKEPEIPTIPKVEILDLLSGAIKYIPASRILKRIEGDSIETVTLGGVSNIILSTLVMPPNRVLSSHDLLDVLNERIVKSYRTSKPGSIKNQIQYIREALGSYSESLRTVRGSGYVFDDLSDT